MSPLDLADLHAETVHHHNEIAETLAELSAALDGPRPNAGDISDHAETAEEIARSMHSCAMAVLRSARAFEKQAGEELEDEDGLDADPE